MSVSTSAIDGAPAPQRSRRQINLIFATIAMGMLLAALDQAIVGTALPTIVADLGSPGHMSWVVTAYLIAETVSAVLAGKFGDLFGRKLIFQLSATLFIVASVFCGLAGNMFMLIGARAVQGIGAGGLMVTAMALIADVIPLRDRGRYQGALGSVFGVSTVLGPLLGGLFTDHLSWRWAFYVNLPLGIMVVLVAARTMPSVKAASRPVIDYLGIVLVALGASGLTLATSWGGTEYAWGSAVIIGLFAGSAVALALFVRTELRAKEPTMPMRLFLNPVFAICAPLSLIVGFAMFGSMIYLPTFMQYVRGDSATLSGLRMLPLVLGLLVAAIVSGNIVSRTGRYRIFPIAGTAVMALGMYFLSTMTENTSMWLITGYMVVLGLGVGLCMQVLVIIVQGTVPYRDMGVATSGVSFFRTLGGSFGTAIFGTVFTTALTPKLGPALLGLSNPGAGQSPQQLHKLPETQAAPVIHAYAEALQPVFLLGVPVALAAFLLALFLKELPLRDTAQGDATDLGEGFGAPEPTDCMERTVANLVRRERRTAWHEVVTRSQTTLDEAEVWGLAQVTRRTRLLGHADLGEIAEHMAAPVALVEPVYDRLIASGYLVRNGMELALTAKGEQEVGELGTVWRTWLTTRLDGWGPEDEERLKEILDRIVHKMLSEDDRDLTPAGNRSS